MSAVEAADSSITVLLCDEGRLRRECLAGFLELSGVRVRTLALNSKGSDGAEPPGARADLAIINTGQRSCSHPGVKGIFDLRSTLPSVPIAVISGSGGRAGGDRRNAVWRARLFPVEPRPSDPGRHARSPMQWSSRTFPRNLDESRR
jgi:hypothetical protein